MARSRTPFNSSTVGPITGPNYMDNVKDRIKDLWDLSSIQLSAIGGTANAITATCDPALTAGVTTGMKFSLIVASTNSTGVTLSINGGSAINVRDDNGNALLAGSLTAGRLYTLEFDGTNLRVQNSSGIVKVNNAQIFTASGTWTKPAGTPNEALVSILVWAGGGGGGNGNAGASSGGGGGGFIWFTCKAGDLASTVSVTIGAGGALGGAGGTSAFGYLVSIFGGGAGTINTGGANRVATGGGGGGGFSAGGNGASASVGSGAVSTPAQALGGESDAGTSSACSVSAGSIGTITNANSFAQTGRHGGGAGGSCANGGSGSAGENGGKSIYGGGGGAGRLASLGGTSQFGGAGGAPGAAGQIPGGGGGNNGVGARGEVRVYVNG